MIAYAPHYKKGGDILELQQKVHVAYNDVNMAEQRKDMEGYAEVTLDEGDILYHPAGIWHCVKSETDSIAINFSMKAQRVADIITPVIYG